MKMTGSAWSFLGVVVTVVGTLIAAYGAWLSGQEAKSGSDQLVAKSGEVIARTSEVAAKSAELAKKSDELAAKSDQLAAKSDEIAKLNRDIAALGQKYAAYTMGEGSYFYLHARGFGGASARADIKHVGANPVRDTEILIFDITDQIPDLVARRTTKYDVERPPSHRFFLEASYAGRGNRLNAQVFPANPDRNTYAYFVNMQGANGTYRQIIQFIRVGNEWKAAYVVQKVLVNNTYEPIGQYFDEGFPTDNSVILRPSPDFRKLP